MKKIFALALLMCLFALPALAEACNHTFEGGKCTACSITGGYCGADTNEGGEKSVIWTLDDSGAFTISGAGAMGNYVVSGDCPWDDDRGSITSAIIQEGVTSIAANTFCECIKLTSIVIPASVEALGYYAFCDCTTLETVTFAEGSRLTTIDYYAFGGCYMLKQITIPASVETLGDYAFIYCDALETVTFAEGSRLTSIGGGAFYDCNKLKQITIPASVTTLGKRAFSGCASLETVTFAEGSDLTIGDEAFEDCERLTSITIPDRVTSIGKDAFNDCWLLTTVYVPCSWNETLLYDFGEDVEVVSHKWSYAAAGATITERCSNDCNTDGSVGGSVTLIPPEPCVYDGAPKEVTVKAETAFVNPIVIVPEVAYTGDCVSAGTFTASLTVGGATATLDVTIAKADSSVSTLPAAKTLTYTGSAQALIAAGEAAGGTMVYSLDGVSFSEAIPTGTNAGEYTVYYKAMGDKNHNDTPVDTVVVSIAKAAPVIPTGLTAIYSQTLDDVELPAGWEWIERTAPVGEAGERGHLANYAGDANHEDAQDVVVMVSVGQSATAMSAASDKPAYIYGEYVVVTVTPAATGVSAYGLRARFAAPAAGTVSLWNGETQITEGKPAANGQEVTFDLSTVADCLTPGSYTLKAKYTESDNMAEQTAEVSFTVAYAETEKEAEESGEQLENGIYAESPTLTAPEGTQISLSNGPDAQWSDELLLPTRDGTHTYTYYMKLENGTIAEKTVTLTADTMPPEVAEPTVLVDPTSAVITVTATDAGSGVMDIRLKVNSGEGDLVIEGNGDGSYTITGLIPGETYDLTLIARDWAGHTTSVSFSLTAPQFPTIPQTGDESRAALWLAMLAFAGAGMLLLRRRAHN